MSKSLLSRTEQLNLLSQLTEQVVNSAIHHQGLVHASTELEIQQGLGKGRVTTDSLALALQKESAAEQAERVKQYVLDAVREKVERENAPQA